MIVVGFCTKAEVSILRKRLKGVTWAPDDTRQILHAFGLKSDPDDHDVAVAFEVDNALQLDAVLDVVALQ